MNYYDKYKQYVIEFVSKIPEFKRDLSLINDFLGKLDDDALKKMLNFLKNMELLFTEETVSGDYSCQTGVLFEQLNSVNISSFIDDLKNGKYDVYF